MNYCILIRRKYELIFFFTDQLSEKKEITDKRFDRRPSVGGWPGPLSLPSPLNPALLPCTEIGNARLTEPTNTTNIQFKAH